MTRFGEARSSETEEKVVWGEKKKEGGRRSRFPLLIYLPYFLTWERAGKEGDEGERSERGWECVWGSLKDVKEMIYECSKDYFLILIPTIILSPLSCHSLILYGCLFGCLKFGRPLFGSVLFGFGEFGSVRCGWVQFSFVMLASVPFSLVGFGSVRPG